MVDMGMLAELQHEASGLGRRIVGFSDSFFETRQIGPSAAFGVR
jgi:hypothetical protein